MADEAQPMELPERPGVGKPLLIGAAIAAAIGAIVGAISGHWSKLAGKAFWGAIAKGAGAGAVAGGVVGGVQGINDGQKYDLAVDNLKLQSKIEELQTDKSFAVEVANERKAKELAAAAAVQPGRR